MLLPDVFAEILKKIDWYPILDICCDVLGSNALALFYFDARSDSLQQLEYLKGKNIVCNPPYDQCDKFIDLIEKAH